MTVRSDYKGLTVYTSDRHLRRICLCSFMFSPIHWSSRRTTVDFKSHIQSSSFDCAFYLFV